MGYENVYPAGRGAGNIRSGYSSWFLQEISARRSRRQASIDQGADMHRLHARRAVIQDHRAVPTINGGGRRPLTESDVEPMRTAVVGEPEAYWSLGEEVLVEGGNSDTALDTAGVGNVDLVPR